MNQIMISVLMLGISFTAQSVDIAGADVVTYKQTDTISLKLHLLYPGNHQLDRKQPAIIFFFGGGWVSGNVGHFEQHARYFASRGMIAILADYRVKNRHGTDPFAAVEDAFDAMRYIRDHADKLGIDENKIVSSGGSAGGHLAVSMATLMDFQNATQKVVPSALILFNPVINTMEEGYGYERLQERAQELSPAHHVHDQVPPTIIFHGTEDTVVPYANILDFEEKMQKAGNTIEVHDFPGQGHGFFNFGRSEHYYFRKTVELADQFLIKHGYLQGAPAISSD